MAVDTEKQASEQTPAEKRAAEQRAADQTKVTKLRGEASKLRGGFGKGKDFADDVQYRKIMQMLIAPTVGKMPKGDDGTSADWATYVRQRTAEFAKNIDQVAAALAKQLKELAIAADFVIHSNDNLKGNVRGYDLAAEYLGLRPSKGDANITMFNAATTADQAKADAEKAKAE